jgi:hypothetical protein
MNALGFDEGVWFNAQFEIMGLSVETEGLIRIYIQGDPKAIRDYMPTWGMLREEKIWNKIHWYKIGEL